MSSEFKLDRVNAGLFGLPINLPGSLESVLAIKFNDQELAAIMTVIGIVLRAAGLQGLYSFIALMIQLEQQYIAGKTGTTPTPPAAPTANTK